MKSIFLSFTNILSSIGLPFTHWWRSKSWTICLPSGANDESSNGIETKMTPFSLSNSSQFSTIIWWQLKLLPIRFFSTPRCMEQRRRRFIFSDHLYSLLVRFYLQLIPFFYLSSKCIPSCGVRYNDIWWISSPFESLTPTAFSSFKSISITLAL